jgi:hypothetical protein
MSEEPRKVIQQGHQQVFAPQVPPQGMASTIEALAGVIHAQALLILELSEKVSAKGQEEAQRPGGTL